MNAKRIVVVGSRGRLGAALVRHFAARGVGVVGLGRAEMDLVDLEGVVRVLGGLEFDVLVNCAALTSVDYCEANGAEAEVVNALVPGVMAEVCVRKGARMVHVSTDYVYDGREEGLKGEEARVRPRGVYAETKRAGELGVLAGGGNALVLRTAWVFGPDRAGFIDSILDRAMVDDRVRAISDKVSSVCSSVEFGGMLEGLLGVEDFGGVVNVCQRGACSWLEFARCGMSAARECGVAFRAEEIGGMLLEEMDGFAAERPRFTGMDTGLLSELTGVEPLDWEVAVERYVKECWVRRLSGGGAPGSRG